MAFRLKRLSVREISSVDRGAGEGVKVMLMKRDEPLPAEAEAYLKREFSADQRKELASSGAAMPGGEFPIKSAPDLRNAVQAFGRAKDPDATKKHIIARARALGATKMLPDDWKVEKMTKSFTEIVKGLLGFSKASVADEIVNANEALAKSVDSILSDTTLDATAKSAAIGKSFDQHADHLNGSIPAAIEKALSDAGLSASDFTKGTPDVTIDFKKALGLAADATDDQVTKALEAQTAATAALTVAKREIAVLKMSDKHSAFMAKGKMPSGGKEAFTDMSAGERDKHISANPVDAEDAKDGGADEATEKRIATEVAKRLAADPQVVDLRKRVDEMQAERELVAFTKRAVDTGLGEVHGVTLQKAYAGDKTAIDTLLKLTKSSVEQAREGGLFKEFGGSGSGAGLAPHDEIMAKAHELRKASPELSIAQAYAKIYADPAHHEIAKRDVIARRQAMGAA